MKYDSSSMMRRPGSLHTLFQLTCENRIKLLKHCVSRRLIFSAKVVTKKTLYVIEVHHGRNNYKDTKP
jgi:hypothetical protein